MPTDRLNARPTALLFLLLLLLASACSGLGGEPVIVATIPAPTDAPAEATSSVAALNPPVEPLAIAQGAAIFAENCTRCHGIAGQGDGPLVQSGELPVPPPDMTDAGNVRDDSPLTYFEIITNGRLETLMPQWRRSLSDAERWAVAAYTFTLHYTPEQIEQGAELWAAQCADCHGDDGAGDGPRASEFDAMPDLSAPDALVGLSDSDILTLLSGDEASPHRFDAALDEAQQLAVIAYARTLSLADADQIGVVVEPPAVTTEAEATAAVTATGSVRGRVTSGTGDSAVQAGQTVTLWIYDSQLNQQTLQTQTDADGNFAFEGLELRTDSAYLVTTDYEGITFSSDVRGGTTNGGLDLPITVYAPTDDASAITINSFVAQVSAAPDHLQVAQIASFSNSSDRVYRVVGAGPESVRVPLPAGAEILNTADDANRYRVSEDGTALIDTRPVLPGDQHLVHVIYALPYDGSAQVDLPLPHALDGPVRLLVSPETLQVSSAQLNGLGTQTMGGNTLAGYGADLTLAAGDVLSFQIIGSVAAPDVPEDNLLPYILIVLGSLSMLVAAILFYFGRRQPAPVADNAQTQQMLIDEIAALDDLHQQGQIDEAAYRAQRDALKRRLSKLMQKK